MHYYDQIKKDERRKIVAHVWKEKNEQACLHHLENVTESATF